MATLKIKWGRQPLGRVSDRAIARRLGCSSNAVRAARLRRGIKAVRTMSSQKQRHRQERALTLWADGASLSQIGRALGVSRQRAYQLVSREA